MYRLEAILFLLASLPFVMACIYASAVAPRRKTNMQVSLRAAAAFPRLSAAAWHEQETTDVIALGAQRVERDFDSLYSSRLLIPAFLLSVLYGLGFSLGLSLLLPDAAHGYLLWPFTAFGPERALLLGGPAFAMVGAYTFNAGVLVRRAFMADFTKNVMWSCLNRLILSVGFAVFLHTFTMHANAANAGRNALCFAIAFFPSVFITALRKRTRKSLGVGAATSELDIQLIQGIDVWKEERLSEEGIESVQNMATADIFGLLPKVHYPLRTIIDWMDQAIFIQRFPTVYLKWQQAGFAVSAIRFAAIVDPSLTGATPVSPSATLPAAATGNGDATDAISTATLDTAQLETAQPNASQLDTSQLDTSQLDTAQLDTAQLQTDQPPAATPAEGAEHAGSIPQLDGIAQPTSANDQLPVAFADPSASAQLRAMHDPAVLYSQSSIIAGQPAPDITLLQSMAHAAGIDLPVLRETLTDLANDASIRVLARLWQSGALTE